ncbi:MAG: hypothetical protein E7478_01745 [Ruminococcaceae bacterium]|nr:hypothetical protein [Oscillospiraceae bacterium]
MAISFLLRKNRSRSSAAALELLLAVLFYWTHYACGKTLNARLEMPLTHFIFASQKPLAFVHHTDTVVDTISYGIFYEL